MTVFSWPQFLIYAVVTAFTPGPNNIMSMTNGSRKGFKKAVIFNVGMFAGQIAVMALCVAFCSLLSVWVPKIKTLMIAIGACYMLWLAWETFRSGELSERESERGTGFISGALLQFINPKYFLYCIMSLEVYILPCYAGNTAAIALLVLLLVLLAFVSTVTWTVFGSVFRRLFSKHAKLTNTVMALLLVYCAVSLFL